MALTNKLTAIADAIRARSGKTDGLTLDQMPDEIANIKGGAEINFEVVGNPQPPAPTNNTIWVDTDTEITGWHFKATEPESPSTGMVWFPIGTESPVEFNALKENGIEVYPLSAKQYVGGAWVDVTTKTYQGGEWVEWLPEGALYYFGNQCVSTSGGWNARGIANNSQTTGKVTPTVTHNDDHMNIYVSMSSGTAGLVEVINDQDLTNISTIDVDFEVPSSNGVRVKLAILDRSKTNLMEGTKAEILLKENNITYVERTSIALDVSSMSGYYNVAIVLLHSWSGSKTCEMNVYSVLKK